VNLFLPFFPFPDITIVVEITAFIRKLILPLLLSCDLFAGHVDWIYFSGLRENLSPFFPSPPPFFFFFPWQNIITVKPRSPPPSLFSFFPSLQQLVEITCIHGQLINVNGDLFLLFPLLPKYEQKDQNRFFKTMYLFFFFSFSFLNASFYLLIKHHSGFPLPSPLSFFPPHHPMFPSVPGMRGNPGNTWKWTLLPSPPPSPPPFFSPWSQIKEMWVWKAVLPSLSSPFSLFLIRISNSIKSFSLFSPPPPPPPFSSP